MDRTSSEFPVTDLENLLCRGKEKTTRIIENAKWKYLTAPGENFGSLMFALDVKISETSEKKSKDLNVVVKLPPKSAYLQDLFNSPVTFDKELRFYRDVVPEFEKLQRECGFQEKDLIKFVPKFVAGRLGAKNSQIFDDQGAIILENLNLSGYKTLDRLAGFDEEHTRFAIKELANLHALTIGLKMKNPETFRKLVLPALKPFVNETAGRCLEDMLKKARADMKTIPDLRDYLNSIEKTLDFAAERRIGDGEENPWKTIVHNDFWVNNVMFKHEKNVVKDMKIVDFQLCLYDYGIKDLLFFLMSSVKKSIIDDRLNEFIDFYYSSFVDSVKSLKIDANLFPRSEFLKILRQCAPVKFEQSIFMAQVIQASRGQENEKKLENQDNTPSFFNSVNESYKEKLVHVVKTFDKQGWLVK